MLLPSQPLLKRISERGSYVSQAHLDAHPSETGAFNPPYKYALWICTLIKNNGKNFLSLWASCFKVKVLPF